MSHQPMHRYIGHAHMCMCTVHVLGCMHVYTMTIVCDYCVVYCRLVVVSVVKGRRMK